MYLHIKIKKRKTKMGILPKTQKLELKEEKVNHGHNNVTSN